MRVRGERDYVPGGNKPEKDSSCQHTSGAEGGSKEAPGPRFKKYTDECREKTILEHACPRAQRVSARKQGTDEAQFDESPHAGILLQRR
ncbi:hypothetical protein ATCV1_z044R [Acanthocystis turfacea chlorella virus 1]|uniref:Uncharacterized protein z044R n=1 Tax=Chlorovirus heliozoae TaxID=322019 RepID=A7K804_9PHYC|nr:hypothetical protein ATCV1_z044R [Acanthocystis turfacea chlorella virus 1]ABT16178.1 hypothetical protein ATCV1_z044R [Acanthocystis turfacea chlorella virus 1]